jgi:transcriptional regulator with XRE-family HTH domain
MSCEIEASEEFATWFDVSTPDGPESVNRAVELLELYGPKLGSTQPDTLKASKVPNLKELRQMTQVRLAEVLGVNQGAISKLERRSDMYLSTLRSYIEAMGGQLEIRAVFPDGEIMIEQFGEIGREGPVRREEAAIQETTSEPIPV